MALSTHSLEHYGFVHPFHGNSLESMKLSTHPIGIHWKVCNYPPIALKSEVCPPTPWESMRRYGFIHPFLGKEWFCPPISLESIGKYGSIHPFRGKEWVHESIIWESMGFSTHPLGIHRKLWVSFWLFVTHTRCSIYRNRAPTRSRPAEPLNPTEPQVGEEETVSNGPTESRSTDRQEESERETARQADANGDKPRHLPLHSVLQGGSNHRKGFI
jgi:hypothetical protein